MSAEARAKMGLDGTRLPVLIESMLQSLPAMSPRDCLRLAWALIDEASTYQTFARAEVALGAVEELWEVTK